VVLVVEYIQVAVVHSIPLQISTIPAIPPSDDSSGMEGGGGRRKYDGVGSIADSLVEGDNILGEEVDLLDRIPRMLVVVVAVDSVLAVAVEDSTRLYPSTITISIQQWSPITLMLSFLCRFGRFNGLVLLR
jgi:hypothetical protein